MAARPEKLVVVIDVSISRQSPPGRRRNPWAVSALRCRPLTETVSDKFGAIAVDSLINAAGRALATGDALGALKRVALREDPPALALRGIAMAQLGDLASARALLRRAARAFPPTDTLARARCLLAEAEIALASRDLGGSGKTLDVAIVALARQGDRRNAAYGQLLKARFLLLIGKVEAAAGTLDQVELQALAPAARAGFHLARSAVDTARLRIRSARSALDAAVAAAHAAGIPALDAEVDAARAAFFGPVARLTGAGRSEVIGLEEVETMLASDHLVLDACRRVVRARGAVAPLVTRPVLFRIARTLAEAWPGWASRQALAQAAFGTRHSDESVRVRLRVEIGRLRTCLRPLADIRAMAGGFALITQPGRQVIVLAPLVDDANAAVLALLSDGEAWSSSALAMALGISQRTVQRALDALLAAGKVRWAGAGPSRRWLMAAPHFPTALLLPAADYRL